jgi:predicted phosphate transport protein (TIGR00153 family)
MKINDLLKFLVPKDESFFPLFEGQANCTSEGAKLLSELIYQKTDEERQIIFNKIKDVEGAGDIFTHKIYEQLNKSFLTPFDREDIHSLASHIDDVLDYIYAVSQRIQWYKPKPKKISEEFKNFVEVINKMSGEIQVGVHLLRDASLNKERILQACITLNTLENEADRIFYAYMSSLFENKNDDHILEIIKNKDIFQTLEKCADAAEDVSDVIKTILIKNV